MRSALFLAIFALFWITTAPFLDLRNPNVLLAAEAGSPIQQICFLAVFVMSLVVLQRCKETALIGISPALICILAWQILSVLTSTHPDLSIRRFTLSTITLVITLAWTLLPRNAAHFSKLLMIGSLATLGLAYFGVVFLPGVSIHNLDEVLELNNAGGWRGHFAHKNIAGAAMVYLMIYSLYIRRYQGLFISVSIFVGAAFFLYKSDNKTSIGLVAFMFILSSIISRVRSFGLLATLMLGPIVAMMLFTIGSVIFEPIHTLVVALSSDPTFTARTDVWRFGIDQLMHRPLLGYGFDAFWATSELINGGYTIEGWAATAGHAHNADLNVALSMGLPGMVLVIYWTMWEPVRDYYTARQGSNDGDLTLMYLRIWIFSMLYACLESPFFESRGPTWFAMLGAMYGLRYHARAVQVVSGPDISHPREPGPTSRGATLPEPTRGRAMATGRHADV